MANFVFKGLRLTTADEIERAIRLVGNCSSHPVERVSLSLHAQDFAKLAELVEGTSISNVSAFCWSAHQSPSEFSNSLVPNAAQARIAWANRELYFEEDFVLPFYDWEGSSSGKVRITFSESFQKPFAESTGHPRPEIWLRLANALEIGESERQPQNRTSSIWAGHLRTHSYVASIPAQRKNEAIVRLAEEFALNDASCSWELSASVADLPRVLSANKVFQNDYPKTCSHLNGNQGAVNFAVQPHWLIPVLNCSLEESLLVVGRLISSPFDCALNIRRTFVSWRMADGTPGPRTRGNGYCLNYARGRSKLFVGIEQFSDSDPPVRKISPRFREVAEQLGAELTPNNLGL
jgi:hypothetical protein